MKISNVNKIRNYIQYIYFPHANFSPYDQKINWEINAFIDQKVLWALQVNESVEAWEHEYNGVKKERAELQTQRDAENKKSREEWEKKKAECDHEFEKISTGFLTYKEGVCNKCHYWPHS